MGTIQNAICAIFGGATLAALIFVLLKQTNRPLCDYSFDPNLPYGLPNPGNVCYLNALLQAIAANKTLFRLLRRCARRNPSRFVYRLLSLIQGLRCSCQYIRSHNLDTLLRQTHEQLINEIMCLQRWSRHEQQDAHELFGLIMDKVCGDVDNQLGVLTRPLSNLFNYHLPDDERVVLCCFPFLPNETLKIRPFVCDPIPTWMFEQNLIASRIVCSNCDYRSNAVIQPESCLSLFLNSNSYDDINQMTSPTLSSKVTKSSTRHLLDFLADQFITKEILPDVKCPNCHLTSSDANHSSNLCHREQFLIHVPNYLVLYVQRSDWRNIHYTLNQTMKDTRKRNHDLKIGTKLSNNIHIPDSFDISQYLLSGNLMRYENCAQENHCGDNNVQYSKSNSYLDVCLQKQYILRSVVVHQGAFIQSGHYIAYRKWSAISNHRRKSLRRLIKHIFVKVWEFFHALPPRNPVIDSPWLLTSDDYIIRVSSKEVESSPGYMLFYERLPSKSGALITHPAGKSQNGIPCENGPIPCGDVVSSCRERDNLCQTSESEFDSEDELRTNRFRLSKAENIRQYTSAAASY